MRSDFFPTKPKIKINIDRNRAFDLGISLQTIGRTLETMLGSRIVTTFVDRGEEYNVVLQGVARDRATPSDLANIYVRSERSGQLVPLANLVQLEEVAGPKELKRFNQLRSVTLTASLAPGYSLGEAVKYMEKLIATELPPDAAIAFDGEARELKESGSAVYLTFGLALIIVFLVLAAQFESFRHPLIIMLTVPLALTGGLVGLWLFGSSINVYSQIGAIMLIGLAAKNGILIVEFANQLRDRGMEFTEAIVSAAAVRLRPVVMTSLCTAFGAVPLILASRRRRGIAAHAGRHGVLRRDDLGVPDALPDPGALRADRAQDPVARVPRAADRQAEAGRGEAAPRGMPPTSGSQRTKRPAGQSKGPRRTPGAISHPLVSVGLRPPVSSARRSPSA